MRKTLSYIASVLFMLSLASCQNNGHIGWIFGVWRVAEYSIDGQPQTSSLQSSTTFAFQNNIVNVVAYIDDYNTDISRYGTWQQDGDEFTFNFTHHDDSTGQGEGVYAAPEWLGMTSAEPMRMHVISQTDDKFSLEWTDADGSRIIYKFEKTW